MTSFGKRFKQLRLEKDFTQKELAEDFNSKYQYSFGTSAISQYENNKRTPEIEALQDFAKYFNVTTDYLLGRSDNREEIDPGYFKSVDEALKYIVEDGTIFGGAGLDIEKLSDAEKVELANDIKEQAEMVAYKYRK